MYRSPTFEMKTTLKHIALGTLFFLLFSQLKCSENDLLGTYELAFGYNSCKIKLKENNKFKETIRGCYSIDRKGKWKVEKENVILIFKKKYNWKCDTLKIKRKDLKIISLGLYDKLNTED